MKITLSDLLKWSGKRFDNSQTIILLYSTDMWGKEDCQCFYTAATIESIVKPAVEKTLEYVRSRRIGEPYHFSSKLEIPGIDESIKEFEFSDEPPISQTICLKDNDTSLKFGGFMTEIIRDATNSMSFEVTDLTDEETKQYCGIQIWNNLLVRLDT